MTDPDSASRDRPFTAVPQPETDDTAGANPAQARRGLFDLPDGALGIFFLLIIAAVSGGLIAVYWPWQQGTNETSVASDRLAALETRVDQIATGHAPKAAAAAFQDERRDLGALKNRLDADEARLGAIEKATGQVDDIDLVSLKKGIDKATADVAVLSDRIARLEQAPSGGRTGLAPSSRPADQSLAQLRNDLNVRTQQLNDALGKLAARTAALEKNAPPADLAARLDAFALKSGEAALESRIGKLEDQDTAGVMRRAAAVLALADLVRASGSAESFGSELDALKALVPASPEVVDLSHYASKGVPTRTMLADRFSQRASAIVAAQRTDQAQGWSERLWANLANLVSVRRVGDIPGHDVESRVARAEVDLHAGDLVRAVSEVNALKGSARAAAGDWLDEARGRLAVDRDARLLATRVVASLARPASSASSHASTPVAPPPGAGPTK
jgi:hypothetical protein